MIFKFEISALKLGYNELVYNKLQVKAYEYFPLFWSKINVYYINHPGYNESLL